MRRVLPPAPSRQPAAAAAFRLPRGRGRAFASPPVCVFVHPVSVLCAREALARAKLGGVGGTMGGAVMIIPHSPLPLPPTIRTRTCLGRSDRHSTASSSRPRGRARVLHLCGSCVQARRVRVFMCVALRTLRACVCGGGGDTLLIVSSRAPWRANQSRALACECQVARPCVRCVCVCVCVCCVQCV